jgi:stress-induced-phosphoprotein 1
LKALGNKAFAAGDHPTAIQYFSQAIERDSSNHVLFSNRSASYASLKDYELALQDADSTTSLKPDWAKGWGRKGAALMGLQRYMEAKNAYAEGLKLDPSSVLLKKGLDDAEASLQQERSDGGIGKLFAGDIWTRMATNPKLSHLLAERDFVDKVKQIQANPSLLNQHAHFVRVTCA